MCGSRKYPWNLPHGSFLTSYMPQKPDNTNNTVQSVLAIINIANGQFQCLESAIIQLSKLTRNFSCQVHLYWVKLRACLYFIKGALAWNGDMLSSGSRDRLILQRDARTPSSVERRLIGHRQEVGYYLEQIYSRLQMQYPFWCSLFPGSQRCQHICAYAEFHMLVDCSVAYRRCFWYLSSLSRQYLPAMEAVFI